MSCCRDSLGTFIEVVPFQTDSGGDDYCHSISLLTNEQCEDNTVAILKYVLYIFVFTRFKYIMFCSLVKCLSPPPIAHEFVISVIPECLKPSSFKDASVIIKSCNACPRRFSSTY